MTLLRRFFAVFVLALSIVSCQEKEQPFVPKFRLIAADTMHFKNFVDCNMAEAWVGDTFRIFPGK